MSEIESAIGINELSNIKNKIQKRKRKFNYLFLNLKNCKNFTILNTQDEKNIKSSYYALTIILKESLRKREMKLF